MSIYEDVKGRVASLQNKFDALFDEAEEFRTWIEETIEEGKESPDKNRQQVSKRLGNQHLELSNFIEALEEAPADALLRLQDRIMILKLAEKGEFV
jgi:hypothetical protein